MDPPPAPPPASAGTPPPSPLLTTTTATTPTPATTPQQQQQQQQYCLRWNNYQTNLTAVFDQLLQHEAFVDVTLSTDEGHALKCHKVVLSACSGYFQSLLTDNASGHPIIILRDIGWRELRWVNLKMLDITSAIDTTCTFVLT